MAKKTLYAAAIAAGVVAVGGYAAMTLSASSVEQSDPAREAVADLRAVTSFTLRDQAGAGCVFDEDRGGLVWEKGLRVESEQTGSLGLTFYVQRNSLDDVLPGYASTVLTFDDDTRSRAFDPVIPVSRADYEAGYDECFFSTMTD